MIKDEGYGKTLFEKNKMRHKIKMIQSKYLYSGNK